MIVDSHQHFWDLDKVEYSWLVPDYGPIYRTFKPAELAPQLAAAGIDRTVLVQSANSFEDTDSMLAHAAEQEWIGAVVGWVPLEDAAEAARILDEKYLANPWFKGVRHLNHDEADPDWLLRPAVIEGLKVLEERRLTYDVVAVYPLHLGHVPTLAQACPDLAIVVDHLAKPPITSRDYDAWKTDMRAAAEHPNVHAKVSGLNTAADWETWSGADLVEPIGFAVEVFGTERLMFGSDWPVAILAGDYAKVSGLNTAADWETWSGADLVEPIGFAVEVFGTGRLMFGSDWPVAILAGDYAKVWRETNLALDELGISGADRDAILGGNAAAFYSIEPTP